LARRTDQTSQSLPKALKRAKGFGDKLLLIRRIARVPENIFNWLKINLYHLQQRSKYLPPENGQKTVLIAMVEPQHPFYLTWIEGIETNGWNVSALPRSWTLLFSQQLFLYFSLCRSVDVIQLIDIDLRNLFGSVNRLRIGMSLVLLRLIVAWPHLLGKPVVYSFGNFVPHGVDSPEERHRHELICKLADQVISMSPSMTVELVNSGIPAGKIWPGEHADTAHFFAFPPEWTNGREEYSIPDNALVVLFAGSIRINKGIETVVQAFRKSINPDIRLVITGTPIGGYVDKDIQKLVENEPRIILGPLEYLSNAKMGWFFKLADFCVLPYRSIGHSGMVCQSLSLGVPVIGTNVGCLPDYLGDGVGLLFEPEDVDGLAAILDTLGSFDRRRASRLGQEIMRQRTPARMGRRLTRIYKYCLGGPKPETEWLYQTTPIRSTPTEQAPS
jgi:beta-1,4-mannosyltransferase